MYYFCREYTNKTDHHDITEIYITLTQSICNIIKQYDFNGI